MRVVQYSTSLNAWRKTHVLVFRKYSDQVFAHGEAAWDPTYGNER
jgi:hypothetical protein